MTQEFDSQYFLSEDLRKRLLDIQLSENIARMQPSWQDYQRCNPTSEKQNKIRSSKVWVLQYEGSSGDAETN